jgi:hypothetical protein
VAGLEPSATSRPGGPRGRQGKGNGTRTVVPRLKVGRARWRGVFARSGIRGGRGAFKCANRRHLLRPSAIEPPTIVSIPPSSIAGMRRFRSIWADGEDEVPSSARIVVSCSAHRRSNPPPSFRSPPARSPCGDFARSGRTGRTRCFYVRGDQGPLEHRHARRAARARGSLPRTRRSAGDPTTVFRSSASKHAAGSHGSSSEIHQAAHSRRPFASWRHSGQRWSRADARAPAAERVGHPASRY